MTATVGYTSADLLMRFNLYTGRPAVDAILNTTKYLYLADAQQYTLERIATIDAKVLYTAPIAMITADGGLTYTFGVADSAGNLPFPMGRARIFNSLNAIPGGALVPGRDYLDEGVRIRAPYNSPIAGPLYWYGLSQVAQLSDTTPPVFVPVQLNMLTVLKATADFAESANIRNGALSDRMLLRYEREFGVAMTMLRKRFAGGGAVRLFGAWAAAFGPSLSSASAA